MVPPPWSACVVVVTAKFRSLRLRWCVSLPAVSVLGRAQAFAVPWLGHVCESVSGLCFSVCCDGAAHSRPSGPVMVIRVGVLCSVRLGVFVSGYFSLLRLFGCLRALSFVFCQSLFLSVRTTFSCHFFRFFGKLFSFLFHSFFVVFPLSLATFGAQGLDGAKKEVFI